jgi:DNA-binding transcriptional LysR family regulator
MNLNDLQLFVEVARKGSFAAVARDHDKAATTVSRAIAGLESELGVRLLQRSTRRMHLTEAGRVYLETAEEAMALLAQAGEKAVALTGRPYGKLRMTTSATFGQVGIVPLLPGFLERYPELDVELLMSDTRLDLISERIDVAIRLGSLHDTNLVATKLCDVPYHVCASPGYLRHQGRPKQPTDLTERDCLYLNLPGFNTWQFSDIRHRIVKVTVRGRFICSNVRALKQCALSGMGIVLLPRWIVHHELTSGELIDLFPEWMAGTEEFKVPVWLLYPSQQHLPLKVRVFIDYVKDAYRAMLPWSKANSPTSSLSQSHPQDPPRQGDV